MFQYTTETIINKNEGSLAGGKRFVAADSNSVLLIDGVAALKKACIKAVYKRPYVASVNEKIVITIPTTDLAAGDIVRLQVKLTQEGLVSAIYKDAYRVSKKPFFYEIKLANKAKVAEELEKVISREMRHTDFNFFKASASGAVLTLEAKDCYTRFADFDVAKVEVSNVASAHTLTGYQDFVSVLAWKREEGTTAAVTLTAGKEGAGTVARLIKDLRVPTDANTNPFASDNGGKPVPGGQYTQYTIEYVTPSRHIAGGVVGELSQSLTTHILFIEAGIVSNFDAVLTALSLDTTNVDVRSDSTTATRAAIDKNAGSKQ